VLVWTQVSCAPASLATPHSRTSANRCFTIVRISYALEIADDLVAGPGRQGTPGRQGNVVADEPDAAVGEGGVDPAWVQTAGQDPAAAVGAAVGLRVVRRRIGAEGGVPVAPAPEPGTAPQTGPRPRVGVTLGRPVRHQRAALQIPPVRVRHEHRGVEADVRPPGRAGRRSIGRTDTLIRAE